MDQCAEKTKTRMHVRLEQRERCSYCATLKISVRNYESDASFLTCDPTVRPAEDPDALGPSRGERDGMRIGEEKETARRLWNERTWSRWYGGGESGRTSAGD